MHCDSDLTHVDLLTVQVEQYHVGSPHVVELDLFPGIFSKSFPLGVTFYLKESWWLVVTFNLHLMCIFQREVVLQCGLLNCMPRTFLQII